jgi:hypothetical protein
MQRAIEPMWAPVLARGAAMRAKLLVLSVFLLFSASQRTAAQSLEGIWVTVLDVSGAVYPHVEELRIARDGGVTTAIYGY